jgi:transmembrane sensor
MTGQRNHHTESADRQSRSFFSGGNFRWSKSREEVWAEMEKHLTDQPAGQTFLMNRYFWAVAAGMLLIIGSVSFFRLYKVTIEAPAGIHQTAHLPDGSKVELNAVSSLSYYPYHWKSNRSVHLEGEAHFEVTPGKRFSVVSAKGKTEVLGTSFNIYAREINYQVTCLTGKVKVTSKALREVILHPESKAEILDDGTILVSDKIDTYPVISWRSNIFLFTAKPIKEVFSEIERQYNITIHSDLNDMIRYTGNFTKEQHVEEILGYICPALGLKYDRKSGGVYNIIQLNE